MNNLLDRPSELVGIMVTLAFLIFFVDFAVVWMMDRATKGIDTSPPVEQGTEIWKKLLGKMPSEKAGKWLGALERILFFFAIWFGGAAVIAGWLAFKAVSKWDAWSNITKVPTHIKHGDLSDLEFLEWKRRWASWTYMRSAVGTIGNLFAAGLGFLLAKFVSEGLR